MVRSSPFRRENRLVAFFSRDCRESAWHRFGFAVLNFNLGVSKSTSKLCKDCFEKALRPREMVPGTECRMGRAEVPGTVWLGEDLEPERCGW